jgi:lysophospholipase L1-like esterase
MENILPKVRVFGDSIMKGIFYHEPEGRYMVSAVLQPQLVALRLGLEVQATTLFGCTVTKGMQLLQRALANGMQCDYAVLEFGGNDCDFLWDEVSAFPEGEHVPKTPLKVFSATLRSMIGLLRSNRIEPLLMTLPPIDSERYLTHVCRTGLVRSNILHWLGDVNVIARHQELYSLQIATTAADTHCRLLDIRSGFLARKDCMSLICNDGIHPNEEGHELMLRLLADYREAYRSA